jgi:hypothetical protein
LLNWVLGVVGITVTIPLGLIALLLALADRQVDAVIGHGELYLVSANSVSVGSIVLIATRLDDLINAAIASMCAVVFVAVPCYGAWAFALVEIERQHTLDASVTGEGGWLAFLIGLIVSAWFIRVAARSVR